MALPASGPISLQDIRDEMGSASSTVSMADLYRNGGYTPSTASSVPTSGAISFNNFLGTRKWNYTNCNYAAVHTLGEHPVLTNVNDANAKTLWADPWQYWVGLPAGVPVRFQTIYKNTTGAPLPVRVTSIVDNTATLNINNSTVANYDYNGTVSTYFTSLPIGSSYIYYDATNSIGAGGDNPGVLKFSIRDSNNTVSYVVSGSNSVVTDTTCIMHSGNYYTNMTRYESGFTIVSQWSDPNVQLQLASASVGSSLTNIYGQNRLQDYSTVSYGCEIFIGSGAVADGMWLNIGSTANPGGESDAQGGFLLNFQVYTGGGVSRGIYLISRTNGNRVASYVTNGITASAWQVVRFKYTKASGLWEVYWNGNNVISYTDTANSEWLTTSGNYWGAGARTGGLKGDMYIRRVTVLCT